MKKQYKFLEKENWFKHDFRAREDKKLLKLKLKYKSSAPIGIFWQLVEMIYEGGGFLDYDLDILSYNVGDDSEIVKDVIDSCFVIIDDDKLTHETIIHQLDLREEGYIKTINDKSKAGLASAAAKKLAKQEQQSNNNSSTDVKQMLNKNQHTINTTQPEKRVESKETELIVKSKELRDRDEIILSNDKSYIADQVSNEKTFAETFDENKEEAVNQIFREFNFTPTI